MIYDGFSTPIGGGLAAAAQAAHGDGTQRGTTAPPARQCARRFFGQPFGAGRTSIDLGRTVGMSATAGMETGAVEGSWRTEEGVLLLEVVRRQGR